MTPTRDHKRILFQLLCWVYCATIILVSVLFSFRLFKEIHYNHFSRFFAHWHTFATHIMMFAQLLQFPQNLKKCTNPMKEQPQQLGIVLVNKPPMVSATCAFHRGKAMWKHSLQSFLLAEPGLQGFAATRSAVAKRRSSADAVLLADTGASCEEWHIHARNPWGDFSPCAGFFSRAIRPLLSKNANNYIFQLICKISSKK